MGMADLHFFARSQSFGSGDVFPRAKRRGHEESISRLFQMAKTAG